MESEGITVTGANKKNLISILLFCAGCFPLLSGNEVTQAASWPLTSAGRTARIEPENGRRTVAVGTRCDFALFSFSLKTDLAPANDGRFFVAGCIIPSFSSSLPFFHYGPALSCPCSSSLPFAFYALSYFSGTGHKYIFARQTAPLRPALCAFILRRLERTSHWEDKI